MAVNITKYYSGEDANPSIYRGRMTLKKGYTIVDADESCYLFLGVNSALPFTALVHPEDVDSIREALELVKEGEQHLIFRLVCKDDSYRYMYARMKQSGKKLEEFETIDVELLDIMRIYDKFDANHIRMIKYRRLMSLSDKMYFEYSYQDDSITIYEYVNNRSIIHFSSRLELLQAKVLEEDRYSFRQRAELEALCEHLKNYSENFDMEVDSELFGLSAGYLHFQGGILHRYNTKWMMVATVTAMGDAAKEEKYYTTTHAFDSATGVYNKRAIHELTIDLMANAGELPVYFCIIDIDDFKSLNDTFGHMAGDEVIVSLTEVLKNVIGARGYIGRFGGDEFVLVTDQIATDEEFINALKTVRKNVAWMNAARLKNTEVTVSVGIAKYPQDAGDYDSLFKLADKCLYLAKAKGKNRYIIYCEEVHKNFDMAAISGKLSSENTQDIYVGTGRTVAAILGDMRNGSSEELKESIRNLLASYGVDRAAVYAGEDYDLKFYVGNGTAPMESLAYIKQPYLAEFFDEDGMFMRNKILSIRENAPQFYELLERQGTEGFMIVKAQFAGSLPVAVVFDVFQRYRKWSMVEKSMLYIAAQIIARRYLELEAPAES